MAFVDLLAGKIVLVVGGTVGLGAGISRAAAREKAAAVVVTGRRADRGEQLVAELTTEGGHAAYLHGDVSDPASATGVVEETIARFGRIDCLVNAAGLTTRGTLLDTTPELFDQHIAVNLRGPFFTMQAAVANMVERGAPGTIVNIITTEEFGGAPNLVAYSASKGGLATLTRNAAHAHRWDRIRINGLDIGWSQTEGEDAIQRQFHGAGDDWVEKANASVPMGKLGQVEEIADMVVFLLSDRSGVVTGSVIDWDQHVQGAHD